MPRTSTKKRTARKPKAKSVRRKARRNMRSAPRTMDYTKPMPSQLNTKFRYVSNQALFTTGATGMPLHVFSINSLYDPDWSFTGHQPYGYDQLTPFYGRYRVNAVKIKIRFFSSSHDGARVGVKFRNSYDIYDVATKVASQVRETPNVIIKSLNLHQSSTITRYINLSRLQGISKLKFAVNDVFEAPVNANPASQLYADVFFSGSLDNTAAYTVAYTVEIIYYASMFALLTQGQS